MPFQIIFPRALYGGLEGKYQYLFPAHCLGELIGGKGLAETHFGVPQEMRSLIFVAFVFFEIRKICGSHFYGFALFGAHAKRESAVFFVDFARFDRKIRRLHFFDRTHEPFTFRVFDADTVQIMMDFVVVEDRAVVLHGGFFKHNAIGSRARP